MKKQSETLIFRNEFLTGYEKLMKNETYKKLLSKVLKSKNKR